MRVPLFSCVMALSLPPLAAAETAGLTPTLERLETQVAGQPVTVARSGPACPPACLQPMEAAPGVSAIGEAELVAFLAGPVSEMRGVLVDARAPGPFATGMLPGAISVPGFTLHSDNPYRAELLAALGLAPGRSPDLTLVVFGQGPLDPVPVMALRALFEAGYPAERMQYYRGGLDVWTALGLTTGPGS
ncbi:Rhodanese-like domain-containing protein [Roseivivax lentus]|uniref:Rhodanese-like domain-containing protein n=1 Tax=Roseivivax lentus TaxID=633194 RepID=A0A1N7MCU0_9RHOB|nr:rhodanese-like domain-containing protein [Roseivivax lentus]SIS83868.1 Rhodanese-like domain-containing protein [Roseivivax lentus]